MENIYDIIEYSELAAVKTRVSELIAVNKDNKTSMSCRVKGKEGSFLCTLDIKVLFNEENQHRLVFANLYPHRNKRETLDPITNFKTIIIIILNIFSLSA